MHLLIQKNYCNFLPSIAVIIFYIILKMLEKND